MYIMSLNSLGGIFKRFQVINLKSTSLREREGERGREGGREREGERGREGGKDGSSIEK